MGESELVLSMNPEDIKVGDLVNLELLVSATNTYNGKTALLCELPTGESCIVWEKDFEALSPANGIKNAEKEAIFPTIKKLATLPQNFPRPDPAPKYDPCRLFRKGDKVRFRKVNNRFTHELDATLFVGSLGRVAFDERESGAVKVYCFDGVLRVVDANYLELVTPVEELEPYFVAYDDKFYHVHKKGEDAALAVYYESTHPHAKEAAQAECDRLNAEYRKEQNND